MCRAGFSGLEALHLSRRGWNDAELLEFATALREVECPQVTELDLSANDISGAGLEALGEAIAHGALHSLAVLNLSDCSGVRALPEAFTQLRQLKHLYLDGCLGLTALPAGYSKLASLESIHVTHCLKLLSNEKTGLAVLPTTVQVVTEKGAR